MIKKVTYRGKGVEELVELSPKELMNYLNSRARRTVKRGMIKKYPRLVKRIEEAYKLIKEGKPIKTIKTHVRSFVITPKMVGLRVGIHNGKEFVEVTVKPEMIGHVLGEFSMTRKTVRHGGPGIGASKSSKAVKAK